MLKNLEKLISDLFDFAFNNPENIKKIVDIGIVDSHLALRIKENTGFETENYIISVDNYGIRHAVEHHGNVELEKLRGLIAVCKKDFDFLHEIIFEAENIKYGGKSNLGKDVILFEKNLLNLYTAVLEVRLVTKKGKQNRLILETFYIKKTRLK